MRHVMSPADICAQSGRDISTFWLRHVETVRVVAPGAEPGQVQQGCREGSGEGSGEGLGEFGAELSQVRFNSVPEKVPEGPGSTSFRRRFWRRFRKGFAAARFNEASSMFRCHSGSVSAQLLGQVPANFRRTNCENKLLLLLGIPPKLVFLNAMKRA